MSSVFPIHAWEEASNGLEYCGVAVKQEDRRVTLSQEHNVNTSADSGHPQGSSLSTPQTRWQRKSTIRTLSWLASQARPNIQVGVSMAQRKQKAPTYEDIKATNPSVRMAHKEKSEKSEKVTYTKLGLERPGHHRVP